MSRCLGPAPATSVWASRYMCLRTARSATASSNSACMAEQPTDGAAAQQTTSTAANSPLWLAGTWARAACLLRSAMLVLRSIKSTCWRTARPAGRSSVVAAAAAGCFCTNIPVSSGQRVSCRCLVAASATMSTIHDISASHNSLTAPSVVCSPAWLRAISAGRPMWSRLQISSRRSHCTAPEPSRPSASGEHQSPVSLSSHRRRILSAGPATLAEAGEDVEVGSIVAASARTGGSLSRGA
mmetsp:Transcript_34209/g.96968  ORF Transcript_34209/g.96968 Transcript_34209/m.96968 type:complete len:240 (+) Transcript_34209:2193-2912(+)